MTKHENGNKQSTNLSVTLSLLSPRQRSCPWILFSSRSFVHPSVHPKSLNLFGMYNLKDA